MSLATIFADRQMVVGKIEPAIFGSFVEHLGRCVYTGIFEPTHPEADSDGFRTDTLELVKGLNVPIVRYPGGNFVSGYNWRDGIGPRENRPARLDLAWSTTETNQFGVDEFMKWCKKAGTDPMMAVNLGTGTPQEAGSLVEYCNYPGGSELSDLRKANGSELPYGIKTWCLGNEMDGPWQICGMSAEGYADKALAAAKMMHWVDPSIKLVACGSSGREMPTFPEWDRIVLDKLYEQADYISMHRYYWQDGSEEDFFASSHDMNEFIQTIKAVADYVRAKHRSSKIMSISFDEWNVWYQNKQGEAHWAQAPRILEDRYSLKDALVFSGMLNTLVNNCDRVKIACLAQLVNVIAPIFTEPGGAAIKQSIYYPFQLLSSHGNGVALSHITKCDTFSSRHGEVKILSSSIGYNEADKELSLYLVNYSASKVELSLELRGFGDLSATECLVLEGNLDDANTFERPDLVKPKEGEKPATKGEHAVAALSPLSYTVLRFKHE